MPQLLIICLCCFFSSLITLLFIYRLTLNSSPPLQHARTKGKQYLHKHEVSRIGGLGIFIGLILSTLISIKSNNPSALELLFPLLLALPFLTGLIEDISGKIRASTRFLFIIINCVFSVYVLGLNISNVDIPRIDALLSIPVVAFAFTVFAISGLTNAFNIIDGVNGLASMTATMALAGLAYVGNLHNDSSVVFLSLSMIASTFAFLTLNYPKGMIFLGDGGSYLFGFGIGVLSIYTASAYPAISPWFFVAINIYPITETIFTIGRRMLYQKKNPLLPDRLHLHSLIYRRAVHKPKYEQESEMISANSKTAPYLWLLNLIALVPALVWWNSTPIIIITSFVYIICYLWHYFRLVSFRSPPWLT